jgi:hypothetical protein
MPERTSYAGPWGTAVHLEIRPDLRNSDMAIAWWLLTGPWHPAWPQFALFVVHLRDTPGRPPANLQFPGATHELVVMALNPGSPPRVQEPEALERGDQVGHLEPIDVVHQFEATDDEMRRLAELAARGCVDGILTPSTDDAREILRERWLASCVRTLAHMRGEAHAHG